MAGRFCFNMNPVNFFRLIVGVVFAFLVQPAWADIAATINGESLSRAELEQTAAEALGPRRGETLPRELLDRTLQALIDERLLAQAARKTGLDREDDVAEAIARTRRQVRVEAFLATRLRGLAPAGDLEIDRYIASHPRHFSQRLTYHYQRLKFPVAAGLSRARLQEALRTHKEMENVRAWARRNGWPVVIESRWQGAEQIEARYLDLLEKLGEGELGTLLEDDSGQLAIVKKIRAYPDPVDARKLRGAIARGLEADARVAALQALAAQLRAQADIVYEAVREDAPVVARAGDLPVERGVVERELRRRGISSPTPEVTRKVVDALIDEQLLHRAAQEALAGDEGTLAPVMERAVRRLLGSLHLERALQGVRPPAQREVNAVVAQRPVLFSARQVFRFRQLLLQPAAAAALEEIRAAAAETPDWDRLERRLAERGWVGGRSALWCGPEQLDAATLAALDGMADGEVRVLAPQEAGPVVILQRVTAHADPIDVEQAGEFAAQALLGQRRTEAARQLLSDLRAAARVTVAKDLTVARSRPAVPLQTESWSATQWGSFAAATFLALLLPLVPAALAWFTVQSRRKTEFILNFPQQLSLRERIAGFSHAGVFVFAVGLLATAVALALGGLLAYLLRGQLTPDRLLVAGVAGLYLGLAGAALLLLRLRRWTLGAVDNRWWPLLGLLGAQGASLLALRWGLA